MAESPKVSEQALLVYKSIIDQFDIIKKQQWATTNYAVLIYAAIVWIDQHVEPSPTFSWVLEAMTIFVGVIAIGLLIWFQIDLGKLRKRAERANSKLFSEEERNALDLKPWRHPFWRGWNVLVALIAVCLFGAVLVVATVALGPASEEIVTPMGGGN
jgi:uncharacterized sodium:solute symporter family permease YidK